MTYIQLLASRWQALAEEIFARADRVHDADIRDKLRGIAARYERLVQRAEDQSGQWKVQRWSGRYVKAATSFAPEVVN